MKNKKKTIGIIMAVVLLIAASVLGTLAWLTDKTDSITNTFTVGNIDIDLDETTEDYLIVPGVDIEKDPLITVKANSEACYLFVKIEEANWPDSGLSYAIATGWTALAGEPGVYYREVAQNAADQEFAVLDNDEVIVSADLTKENIEAMDPAPTLTFTAYAVQQAGSANAAAAWAKL